MTNTGKISSCNTILVLSLPMRVQDRQSSKTAQSPSSVQSSFPPCLMLSIELSWRDKGSVRPSVSTCRQVAVSKVRNMLSRPSSSSIKDGSCLIVKLLLSSQHHYRDHYHHRHIETRQFAPTASEPPAICPRFSETYSSIRDRDEPEGRTACTNTTGNTMKALMSTA
jgi:hypothetical protein